MPEEMWESAVIGFREARIARVVWNPGRRLPSELVPPAVQLGYSASEVTRYDVGELAVDMTVGDDIYLRGALVLPDEDGLPATLFGKPLLRK
jgi:hypothetical protein